MKAAILEALDRLSVSEAPDPVLTDEDSLILRVHACAVCGSDLRILHHGNARVRLPQIIGHEVAGEVVAVGHNVTRFRVGDRLATGADVPCGECHWCREGLANNCATNYAIGYQFPGGFAEYMPLNALTLRYGPVHAIPDALDYDAATLAEPLGCCLNGLELSHLSPGCTVVVIGAGPAGCMLMRAARLYGAVRVIAVQRSRARLDTARVVGGADEVICSDDGDPVEAVWQVTHGQGADVAITANSSVETHTQALRMVRNRGCVNLFGGLPQGSPPIPLDSNLIHYKELTLTGSHGSVARQHRLALDLLATGVIRSADYITHAFPLAQIGEAFEAAETRAGLKVIVHPQGRAC